MQGHQLSYRIMGLFNWVCIPPCRSAALFSARWNNAGHTNRYPWCRSWKNSQLHVFECLLIPAMTDVKKMKQLAINYLDKRVRCEKRRQTDRKKGQPSLDGLCVSGFLFPLSSPVLHFPNSARNITSEEEWQRTYFIFPNSPLRTASWDSSRTMQVAFSFFFQGFSARPVLQLTWKIKGMDLHEIAETYSMLNLLCRSFFSP